MNVNVKYETADIKKKTKKQKRFERITLYYK